MEGRKRITTAFLLLLACCWLLILSNGGLAQTWQKVVPSGGSCSGSGSSVPTYLGLTSGSYNGLTVGGYTGANAKCVAQYGVGARMMTITDNRKFNRSTDYPGNGWVDIRKDFQMGSDGGVTDYGGLQSYNCGDFNNNVSGSGISITLKGAVSLTGCGASQAIHCVRD